MSYLLEYREAIRRGEEIVGEEMLMELDNLIEDLDNSEYIYDKTKSDIIISFIENCCKLTKAPFYGKPFKLLPWQKAFIEVSYSFKIKSIDTNDWVDRFREILLLIARKNGKTELIAAIILAELLLFGNGAQLVCSGTNDKIASLCYDTVKAMIAQIDPKSIDTWINQKGIKCKYNQNFLFKLLGTSRGKEGRVITLAGLDELHEMKNGDEIYNPIYQSCSTQPEFKIFMFSSEGFVNDGFLDEQTKKYRAIIKKEDKSDEAKRCLPWLYTMDSEREVWAVNDEGINPAWRKANPSMGIKLWSNLKIQVDKARKSKADRIFTLSKDFNFKVSNSTAWLDMSDWNYVAEFNIEDFRNCMCLGAVDLSETTDMTNAKILLQKKDDKRKFILSHYWIPESKLETSDDKQAGAKYQEWAEKGFITICEGNDIDLALVADWFYEMQEKYNIRLLKGGYDQRFKRDWLNKMDFYGWVDREDLIMINQSPDVLHTANRQVESDLKNRLIIGLNDVDKWCLSNAALKVDSRGKSLVVKIDNQASKRIDGAVALVILQETYNRYGSELRESL